jgi:hypothetical protein
VPPLPQLIQGGMAVGVSTWQLARAVAIAGEKLGRPVLGVVSGTGVSDLMIQRLQRGDPDTLRALTNYDPALTGELLEVYGSSAPGPSGGCHRFAPKPEVLVNGTKAMKAHMTRLTIAAAFVEVSLAKSGHSGPVGINIIEKLQLMHLPIILGAMLAGVDYVLVGAGIPNQIPAVLHNFSALQPASYKLDVAGTNEKYLMTLDPRPFISPGTELKKPRFFAIVSHHALAMRSRTPSTSTGSSLKVRRPAATTRRLAGTTWTRQASQSMASGISPTWQGCGASASRSGSPAPMPAGSRTRGRSERSASRSARPSPSATSRAWMPA